MSDPQNSPGHSKETTDSMDPMSPWLLRFADETASNRGSLDRLGSLGLIDIAARFRGLEAVISGSIVSLARPIQSGWDYCRADDGSDWFEFELQEEESSGPIQSYAERVTVGCHGYNNTHLDALNHIAYRGYFYAGASSTDFRQDREQGPSILDWARNGIVTRGIFVDIPLVRSTEWVSPDEPVTAVDIQRGLELADVNFERGDALILYCGRDRFEEGGNYLPRENAPIRPGVGEDAAIWIADNGVSVLCWDMMDARHPSQPSLPVHRLIWAVGLAIVDNCDFSRLHRETVRDRKNTGLLVIAPLAIPGGTGSLVNPLMLL